jgi:NADH:ubiquinone oxidoreductase subunit H
MITNSLSLVNIVLQQQNMPNMVGLPSLFMLFLISCLAETSRLPFDLAEAETELIAGFHVELAGIGFTLFFLAEYANIIAVCILTTTLFLGGWCLSF